MSLSYLASRGRLLAEGDNSLSATLRDLGLTAGSLSRPVPGVLDGMMSYRCGPGSRCLQVRAPVPNIATCRALGVDLRPWIRLSVVDIPQIGLRRRPSAERYPST